MMHDKTEFEKLLNLFAIKVDTVVGLESNATASVSEAEAYKRIKVLWKELKKNKKELLGKESNNVEEQVEEKNSENQLL